MVSDIQEYVLATSWEYRFFNDMSLANQYPILQSIEHGKCKSCGASVYLGHIFVFTNFQQTTHYGSLKYGIKVYMSMLYCAVCFQFRYLTSCLPYNLNGGIISEQ